MTIEKRGNKYRIIEMRNGVVIRLTVDHKPTKIEARELLDGKFRNYSTSQPFGKASEAYISSKKDILSPTTIKSYHSILRNTSERFLLTPVCELSLPVVQAEVNRYSIGRSYKSVKNFSGFIMGVIKFYGGDIKSPKLPQKEVKELYIPTEDDVKAILSEVKGTKYEIPFLLSAMGLRRSEICALTAADLDGNILTVNKALVQDEDKNWVIKQTKTTSSTRSVILPDYLVALINNQGIIYEGFPGQIYKRMTDIQKKLGIPHFSLHKMRHFFASYMHQLGMSDKQIQEAGGWKTDGIMKTVYQHAMNMDEAKKKMADSIGGLIKEKVSE